MPKTPRRVFISYTAEDLKEFADRVIRVVQLLQWIPIDHRDWAPNGVRTVPLCRQQVQDSDIVVLLVAQRYGWIPPRDQGGDGKTSITQLEYQWARELGKPVVPYLLADRATKWPRAHVEWRSSPEVKQPLEAFRAELREYAAAFFTEDPDSVTEKLQLGLQAAEALIATGSPEGAGEDNTLRRPTAAGSRRPDDLPYLCDRSPQSKLFRRTLAAHIACERPRPLLFVVHGNADEAHHAFVQRVSERLMPAVLKEAGGVAQFRTLELEKLEPSEQASFGSELRALLADRLMESQRASDSELVAHLRESGLRGIVPVLQLRASEARKPDAVLSGVHDFWRNFPDLAPKQFVACLLSVTYQVDSGKGLGALRGMFGPDANQRMREAIRSLEEEGRGDLRTGVYVLPELAGVTLGDVETWLGQVREWLPRKHIPEKKKSEIFNGRESICMDDAIEGLESLLRVEEA